MKTSFFKITIYSFICLLITSPYGFSLETKKNPSITLTIQNTGLKKQRQDLASKTEILKAFWKDQEGDNHLSIHQRLSSSQDKFGQWQHKKEIFIQNQLHKKGKSTLLWKLYDHSPPCPLDFRCDYLQDSLEVTDLDQDGLAEVSFAYEILCAGDLSPSEMKVMLYEGKKKYALRGRRQLPLSIQKHLKENNPKDGKYKVDKAFNQAPKEFLDFAKAKWERFKVALEY